MTAVIKRSLQGHEDIIESGMKSFVDVGTSLLAIKTEKLYPEDTFEAYCKRRWSFTRDYAYKLIDSASVVTDLNTIVYTETKNSGGKSQKVLPENEAQARAIADATDDAKIRQRIWTTALETAPKGDDGKPIITAKHVKKTAEAIVHKNGKPSGGGCGSKPPKSPPATGSTTVDLSAVDVTLTASNGHAPEVPPLPLPPSDTEAPITDEETIAPGKDALKGIVCVGLSTVFACAPKYRGLQNELGTIVTAIKELAEGPSGGRIDVQECERLAEQLRVQLKFAAPHTECPKCKRNWQPTCKHCKGSGWLTKNEFGACATDGDRAWLEKRSA